MVFVTEQELRNQFHKSPFTVFRMNADMKLTPGASQFLTDRKISITDKSLDQDKIQDDHRLLVKFQRILSLALITGEQILALDEVMAQEVFSLEHQLRMIFHGLEKQVEPPDLTIDSCTGISQEASGTDLKDCFEVTSFHIQLKKGREIIKLHYLRCSLREFLLTIDENDMDKNNKQCLQLQRKICQVINRLNQMICLCMGGTSCQR